MVFPSNGRERPEGKILQISRGGCSDGGTCNCRGLEAGASPVWPDQREQGMRPEKSPGWITQGLGGHNSDLEIYSKWAEKPWKVWSWVVTQAGLHL